MRISIGKLLLCSLIITVLINQAHALSACNCDTVTSEFTFTNNKALVQHYSIQKSGGASTWTVVSPMSFALRPGESRTVVAFSRIGCDINEGVYKLELTAVAESDVITKSVDLKVSSCHLISISPNNGHYDSCVNTGLTIPLTITNNGHYPEQVNLSAINGSLSDSSINLEVNESQAINLTYTPTIIGSSLITVKAVFSNKTLTVGFRVNSSACSFFNASLSTTHLSLCENSDALVNLTIINNGPGKQFHINPSTNLITGQSMVYVGRDETITEQLGVHSTCDSGVITPMVSVWASGAETINLPLIINLRACYQPIIAAGKQQDNACACEDVNYSFTLYNPGSQSITYALTPSNGDVFFNGSVINELSLPAGASALLIINHKIPCSYEGSLPLSLTAAAINTCAKSSTAVTNISVSSWSDCESVMINAPLMVQPSNESPFTVPITVRNIGLRPTSYNLMVSGSAVNRLLGISRGFLTLDPGDSQSIDLVFDNSNISGSYLTVQALSLDNLASDSAVINFNNSGLTRHDFYYLLLPAGVAALVIVTLFRSKFFNKQPISKLNDKKE